MTAAGTPQKVSSTARVAAATSHNHHFPDGACGLDSWANVYLKHVDASADSARWAEPLRLADGSSAPCKTCIGPKGIPQALVERRSGQDNIDLVPMFWLVERGCSVLWEQGVTLVTPKERRLTLACWNELPYLTKKQLEQTLSDLPPQEMPGRSGRTAGARVCSARIVFGPCACTALLSTASVTTKQQQQQQMQQQMQQQQAAYALKADTCFVPIPHRQALSPQHSSQQCMLTVLGSDRHDVPSQTNTQSVTSQHFPAPLPTELAPGHQPTHLQTHDHDHHNSQLVCSTFSTSPQASLSKRGSLRRHLDHLRESMDKEKRERLVKKYISMPDLYYMDEAPVQPHMLSDDAIMEDMGFSKGNTVQFWKLMAGSGKLSARARAQGLLHLPPVDHRWGFHVGRFADQLHLLWALLVYGCEVLFASPTCTPWGNNSRGWERTKLRKERAAEGLSLQFLTVLCFLQVVMGRSYMIENPRGSDLYEESAIQHLRGSDLPWHLTTLDQCSYGATLEGGLIRKSTDIGSNQAVPELSLRCGGDHDHVHLRGSGKDGARTALAAVYPDELCDAILNATRRISTTAIGGRICIKSKSQNHKIQPTIKSSQTQNTGTHFEKYVHARQTISEEQMELIGTMLGKLRVHAHQQGRQQSWEAIVSPWLRQHPQLQLHEVSADAELHWSVVESCCGSSSRSARPRVADSVQDLSREVTAVSTATFAETRKINTATITDTAESPTKPEWEAASTIMKQLLNEAETVIQELRLERLSRAAPAVALHEATCVEDLVKGELNSEDKAWQYKPYDNSSATWQAAAQRKHQHRRRTNQLIGTASVDLSGPHEPTPLVGGKVGQRAGHYFVVMHIRPDNGNGYKDMSTQTYDAGLPEPPDEHHHELPHDDGDHPSDEKRQFESKLPLLYADIISTKAEAAAATQRLLARV